MIIIIAGPTSSGKTDLSISLAQHIRAEIINCDSRQIYKLMDIGTAKPDSYQLKRAKHHLFDIIYPDEYFNVTRYVTMARDLTKKIQSRKSNVILAGGSGFYINAYIHGLSPLPDVSMKTRSFVSNKCRSLNSSMLYREIEEIDPAYAKKISPNDSYRIRRFFEIFYTVDRPPSEYFLQNPSVAIDMPYLLFYVEKERSLIYSMIESRVDKMINSGLVPEVEKLLSLGYDKTLPSMNTIGYSEIIDMLNGKFGIERASELIKQNTRNFAKRQIIWFRKLKNKVHIKGPDDILSSIKEFDGDWQ